MLSIPLLGYANAGKPLVTPEESDLWVLPVSKSVVTGDQKDYFMLKVEGTSMNDFEVNNKVIDNGSYVLINKREASPNFNSSKDAYLFIVNDWATIKIPKKEWNNIYLLPKSKDKFHQPIILSEDDNISVVGKVVDVYNFESLDDND